jgi:hypothetical protein
VRIYTQEEIENLIRCPKVFPEPIKTGMRLERGHQRNDMRLLSQDGVNAFSVFIRINESFPENFSIGLVFHPRDEPGSFCLLRCNGPHGEFIGNALTPDHHFHCHIHKAKAENMSDGARPERGGEATDHYASFKEALRYFLDTTNVLCAEDYFPSSYQTTLFEMEGPE